MHYTEKIHFDFQASLLLVVFDRQGVFHQVSRLEEVATQVKTEETPAHTLVNLHNGQNYVKTTTWKAITLCAVGFTCGGHLTGAKARRTANDTANTQKKWFHGELKTGEPFTFSFYY